jgi:sugar lactone lactonase YvrE
MKYSCSQFTNVKCDLGEGLVWDNKSARMLMTDIMKGKLIEIDIGTKKNRCWVFEEPVAWVLPTAIHGKYLTGLKTGIALFDICKPDNIIWVNRNFPVDDNSRLNDACVDSSGRVWYGSMNMLNPSASDGRLASFSAKEGLHIHDEGFTVTNGPVISPDEKYLFFNDTLQGIVYRYQLMTESGNLKNRTVFKKFSSKEGFPDGMCFDQEGNLWIALWGGASIVQLDATGAVLKKVSIPALNVTNVCFFGPALDRLVVSTAAIGLSKQETTQYPVSGALFEVLNHGATGIKTFPAALDPSWT